jgi:hypothetical protein
MHSKPGAEAQAYNSVTLEEEIRKIMVGGQPWQKKLSVNQDPISKITNMKSRG